MLKEKIIYNIIIMVNNHKKIMKSIEEIEKQLQIDDELDAQLEAEQMEQLVIMCEKMNELDRVSHEQLNENTIIKRGRGRPRKIPVDPVEHNIVKRPRGRPRTRPEKIKRPPGRPKMNEEDKIKQDATYHRNYYRTVVSQKLTMCEHCSRTVLKAKLGVHQNTKYCISYQN